jgi:hypothetical protein
MITIQDETLFYRRFKMKKLIVAILAVMLFISTAAVYAACPAGCKKACCAKADGEKKGGCEKADPNSK